MTFSPGLSTSSIVGSSAGATSAAFQHRLLSAVHDVVQLYAARINPEADQDKLKVDVNQFMEKIQDDAFKKTKALKGPQNI